MPLLEVTYPAGRLAPEAKATLVADLSACLMRWEGAPDTEFFRHATWCHVHETPGADLAQAGAPADPAHFLVRATVPEGALSPRRKAGLVEEVTTIVLTAEGADTADPAQRMRVWVLITDLTEGNWGAGGTIIPFAQLREAAAAARAQQGAS